MFTSTTKQIMGPVAEAISHLMVLNLDAETGGADIPDLTDLATAVNTQAKNMADVGQSMMSNGDDRLRDEMGPALESILAAAKLLLDCSFDLKKNSRSKDARKKLLTGCSELLESTLKVLDVYDDCEVRRIVNNCEICVSNVDIIRGLKEAKTLVSHVKPVCDQLIEVCDVATNRIEEILHPALKDRLKDAIDNMTKSASLLISTSKTVAENTKNEAAVNARAVCCDSIISFLKQIIEVVSTREYAEAAFTQTFSNLLKARENAIKALENIEQFAKKKNEAEMHSAIKSLATLVEAILTNAEGTAERHSPEALNMLRTKTDEIRDIHKRISQHAKDAITPSGDAAIQPLREELGSMDSSLKQLESLTDKLLSDQLRQFVANNNDHSDKYSTIGRLHTVSTMGDLASMEATMKQCEMQQAQFHDILEQVAIRCDNVNAQSTIRAYEKGIEGAAKILRASAMAVTAKPSDPIAIESFQGALGTWETQIKKVEEIVKSTGVVDETDMISADAFCMENAVNSLKNSVVAKNAVAQKVAVVEIRTAVNRAINSVAASIEKAENRQEQVVLSENKKLLENDLQKLNQLLEKGVAINEDNATKNLLEVSAIAQEHISRVATISQDKQSMSVESLLMSPAILEIKANKSAAPKNQFVKIGEDEVFIADAAPPEPISESEARTNPIKAAARGLKIQTQHLAPEENPIVEGSHTISTKMEKLSHAYTEDTSVAKKDMIEVSKDIHKDCGTFLEETQKLYENCDDANLKSQLKSKMDQISSLSVQLKIVSAVKAAETKDSDSEKQLIMCSQNLMNAIQSLVKTSEAAALRPAKKAGNAALAAVKFRKMVYLQSPTKASFK